MTKPWLRPIQAFCFCALPLLGPLLGCGPSSTPYEPPFTPLLDLSAPPPPTFTDCNLNDTRIVFVTSSADYQGAKLYNNGASGTGTNFRNVYADGLCAALAMKSTYKNEYAYYKAKWAAWLSFPAGNGSDNNNAIDRINLKTTNPKKSWSIRYGSQCAKVFNDSNGLMATPITIIDQDENGNKVDTSDSITKPVRVWTGTVTGGRAAATPSGQNRPPQCIDDQKTGWISATSFGSYGKVESSAVGPQKWTNSDGDTMQIATMTCDKTARLYCFQVDQD